MQDKSSFSIVLKAIKWKEMIYEKDIFEKLHSVSVHIIIKFFLLIERYNLCRGADAGNEFDGNRI